MPEAGESAATADSALGGKVGGAGGKAARAADAARAAGAQKKLRRSARTSEAAAASRQQQQQQQTAARGAAATALQPPTWAQTVRAGAQLVSWQSAQPACFRFCAWSDCWSLCEGTPRCFPASALPVCCGGSCDLHQYGNLAHSNSGPLRTGWLFAACKPCL